MDRAHRVEPPGQSDLNGCVGLFGTASRRFIRSIAAEPANHRSDGRGAAMNRCGIETARKVS